MHSLLSFGKQPVGIVSSIALRNESPLQSNLVVQFNRKTFKYPSCGHAFCHVNISVQIISYQHPLKSRLTEPMRANMFRFFKYVTVISWTVSVDVKRIVSATDFSPTDMNDLLTTSTRKTTHLVLNHSFTLTLTFPFQGDTASKFINDCRLPFIFFKHNIALKTYSCLLLSLSTAGVYFL